MVVLGFWTLVSDFECWAVVADFEFRTSVSEFGFWTIVSEWQWPILNFGHLCPILDSSLWFLFLFLDTSGRFWILGTSDRF